MHRKLKTAVLTTISSAKWTQIANYPYNELFTGDTLSEYEDNEITSHSKHFLNILKASLIPICVFVALSTVIDALDDIYCLQDPDTLPETIFQDLIDDKRLRQLLDVSFIKKKTVFLQANFLQNLLF